MNTEQTSKNIFTYDNIIDQLLLSLHKISTQNTRHSHAEVLLDHQEHVSIDDNTNLPREQPQNQESGHLNINSLRNKFDSLKLFIKNDV